MTFSILSLSKGLDERPNGFHSKGFRAEIEAQITFLKNHKQTRLVLLEDREPRKYTGDLAGWLLKKNIREDYHWAIARINGYHTPFEYEGRRKAIFIPPLSLIDDILQKYNSRQN